MQTSVERRSLKFSFNRISLRNSRGGSKNIASHQSKGGPTKFNISKTIAWKMKGGSVPHHLKICACDTNMEINMLQCRIKFVVKGIDSY